MNQSVIVHNISYMNHNKCRLIIDQGTVIHHIVLVQMQMTPMKILNGNTPHNMVSQIHIYRR